jgi:hypothetical protein
MEESKFYVPTIEEFHVGFEYEQDYDIVLTTLERYESETTWSPKIFKIEDYEFIDHLVIAKFVRVKYLDREDIELLDWVLDEEEDGRMVFTHKYLPYIHLFASIQEYSTYRHITISSDTSILFTGNIKNKSRLRSIMDWTGVLVEKFEGTDEITNI